MKCYIVVCSPKKLEKCTNTSVSCLKPNEVSIEYDGIIKYMIITIPVTVSRCNKVRFFSCDSKYEKLGI